MSPVMPLAEHVAGSHELFVEMMNKRAQELGLANTRYVNATGLDPDGGGEEHHHRS